MTCSVVCGGGGSGGGRGGPNEAVPIKSARRTSNDNRASRRSKWPSARETVRDANMGTSQKWQSGWAARHIEISRARNNSLGTHGEFARAAHLRRAAGEQRLVWSCCAARAAGARSLGALHARLQRVPAPVPPARSRRIASSPGQKSSHADQPRASWALSTRALGRRVARESCGTLSSGSETLRLTLCSTAQDGNRRSPRYLPSLASNTESGGVHLEMECCISARSRLSLRWH